MRESLIGSGGWGYFAGGLEAYARGFSFVEVNTTFYRPVPVSAARRWRSRVPGEFVFSVKSNREITHLDRLRASASARTAFAHDVRFARILRAPFVILETPASLPIGDREILGLREIASIADGGPRVGLEARAHGSGRLPPALRKAMEDLAVLDVVDLSRTPPRVADGVVYARLFGPGPHNVYEFDDAELQEVDRNAGDASRAAFAFHGVRMYKDAARFTTFKRTGRFPPSTGSRGIESLAEVLRDDARFPATRDDLRRDHGWKVIDLDDRIRVHARELLDTLPPLEFDRLEYVLQAFDPGATRRVRGSAGPSRHDSEGIHPLEML